MERIWANPIFWREFRANVRCRKTVVFALTVLGVLSGVILVFWPRSGVFSEVNTNELFSVFLGTNLVLLILLAPAFAATSVTDERERRAFDLLFSSLLAPREILLGKLCASLGMAFLLVLVSMPVTAVCALSGGISLGLLARAYAVILMAALTYGLLGLACSAVCRRSFTSLIVTYVGIVVLAGGTWLPSVLLPHLVALRPLWAWIRALSPFEALVALNYAGRYELAHSAPAAEAAFIRYMAGMCVLAASFLGVFCVYVLRPARSRTRKERSHYTDFGTAVRRKLTFPFYLIDPLHRKRPIRRWRNPAAVAELRSKVFGHPKFIVRCLSACFVLSLLILTLIAQQYGGSLRPEHVRLVAVVFQVGLVALLAPPVSSGSITDERTSGTLLLLRMTPLTAWRVVSGKVQAALAYVAIFIVSSLPVLFALTYLESRAAYWRLGAWVGILVLTTLVLVAAGLFASTFMASTASATAVSYGFSALLCLGTLAVLLLGSRISAAGKALVLAMNPLAAALQVTSDHWFADVPLLFGNRLWENHLYFLGGLSVFLVVAAACRVHVLFHSRG